MVYYVEKLSPYYKSVSDPEDLLYSEDDEIVIVNDNMTNTRTHEKKDMRGIDFGNTWRRFGFQDDGVLKSLESERITYPEPLYELIVDLEGFNEQTSELRERPRKSLYSEFYVPKKSGGLRKIDAPCKELKDALRFLKYIFEDKFHALYHTSAFAYVKNRGTLDCIKRHQTNESRWFGKYDLSNFFGSTTLEFIMKMFSMVFPFSEVVKTERGKKALSTALELAILDGGLPQGTPISPLITNIMMIPIDYKLSNGLRKFENQKFVYTRYADDFLISSKYDFNFREIENFITEVLASFDAPFKINSKKTRYGSSAGSNWNLGVMLNKDNEITIGYKKKRQFKAMLTSFALDTKNGRPWPLEEVQHLNGIKSYYHMVEGKNIDDIVAQIGAKFGVNINKMIKEQVHA